MDLTVGCALCYAMDMDWQEIKTAYITGDKTTRELAKEYGASVSVLQQRCAREGWVKLRKKHRSRVVANACARAGAKQSRKLASIITTVDRLAKRLEEETRDPRYLHLHVGVEMDHDGGSEIMERELEALNTRTLRDVSRAIRDLTASLRDLHGLDTRREQVEDEREERKLRLEERKFEAERADHEEAQSKDVRIILGEGLEDYLP